MTGYQSDAAFRRGLEERLRSRSLTTGAPLARLRKLVVFERFLARLFSLQPEDWILKGGYAIQLRLLEKARTTKDFDLLTLVNGSQVLAFLRQAGRSDLGDWFTFEVEQSDQQPLDKPGGARFHIHSFLAGRTFEEFYVDVGVGDPVVEPVELLQSPPLLAFAGISPTPFPCYPVSQHIAEKIHAYTRSHVSGESSRVKDFVDILLLAESGGIDPHALLRAIQATFAVRNTHTLPGEIPDPPPTWLRPFGYLAGEVALRFQTLSEANVALKRF